MFGFAGPANQELEAHPWHHSRNRGVFWSGSSTRHTGSWNHQLCPDCIAGSIIGGEFIPQLTLLDTLTLGVEHEDRAMTTLEQIRPFTPLIIIALNGLIAGWIVGVLLGGGGLIRNLVVGLIGAFVGGMLVRYDILQLPNGLTSVTNSVPYGTQIVISTIGAAIVVLIARFLGGRSA